MNEIAQEHIVHPTQVGGRKRELLAQASTVFEITRVPKPVDPFTSPNRLYSEIEWLKMELDWLNKKSGIDQ